MSLPEFEYLGPYRIEKILGRGGMGTVYKGVHARSGEPVAVKVLATGVANQVRFRRRFAAEIETLKRLKHPNIVSLLGEGEEQGLLFYSMEYVDGYSLHHYLRQHTRLPWEEVVEIGIQTTAALKHAHDMGIIHRDLKPANLMITKQGQMKLTDFGIAKLFGSTDMTAVGSVIGTADYMSPEQAEGAGVTNRSDLYSLGAVMYALLSGDPPFGGKSVPEVLHAVLFRSVPSLSHAAPDAPEGLCQLVMQLLEKSPDKRPPTALVVGNRLKALQQGTQRRPQQMVDEGQTWSGTNQETIGTELTSLDLSDVDDDELRLTGDERTHVQSQAEDEPLDTSNSKDLPTHEQQTMLAGALPSEEIESKSQTSKARPGEEQPEGLVRAELADKPSGTKSSEVPLTGGGPSHFTPVTEADARPFTFADDEQSRQGFDWLHYGSIAGIVLLLASSIGFGWWMLQPASADELYARIMVALETGDDSRLLAVKDEIEEFARRFPEDERRDEVMSIADEIELTRWTRVLSQRASRSGGINRLSAIEQAFLDSMRARTEDYDSATQKLRAFIEVFEPIENLTRQEQRLVDLAKYAAATGAKPDREAPPALIQLENLVRSAEKNLSSEELKQYYRDLLVLYGDKPWAAVQINRIRQQLKPES